MSEARYVEDFNLYANDKSIAMKQLNNDHFSGKKLNLHFDGRKEEVLEFKNENEVMIDDQLWKFESMPVSQTISLITIHMLAKEIPQYLIYIIDEKHSLITKASCTIHEIEKGSTPLSDTTNLVKREFNFGYMGDINPIARHHHTHDLCDLILETAGSPGNVIRYYIHSDTKISYYQKEWPLGGNLVDKDGVGYGQAEFLKIDDDVYVITFTKHSHGNQPFLLWNKKTERYVGNFAGESRRNHKKFIITSAGFLREIHL